MNTKNKITDTYWEANNKDKNQWLLIDLGSTHKVDQIKINWGENYAIAYKVILFKDQNNQGNTIFFSTKGIGGTQLIETGNVEIRFLRLEIATVLEPIRGCVVREIELISEGFERFIPSVITTLSSKNLSLNGKMWRVQNAMFVDQSPDKIATSGYNDKEWIPATVPGTILGDYYNFGALPDPLYSDNMHQISDWFFSGNDFWYRTRVNFPTELSGKRIFINFSGINYKSEIYFNGKKLGRIDGAFQRAEFEVTDLVNFSRENTLAVLVQHNVNWVSGSFKIIRKTLGERTTNGDMLGLDGPTCLASAGWNWLPIVKGRNNGIWNNVTFRTGGTVSIIDPWVSTIMPIPDTTKADLSIHAGLRNHSSKELEGKLLVSFNKTVIELAVKLSANEEKVITLDKSQFKELSLKNPKLWWPNGYGEQNLSKLKLEFVENGKICDIKNINFGVRQFDYKIKEDVLFIYCNGYRIQLKGGNWGLPEALMRLDRADYDLRVKLHKDANFNMIRNWLGMTNREEFYDVCDKYGILIFDDFWLANPKNGPSPNDLKLFMDNARDKIKWVRKHPSLALYCGRNEGIPPLNYDMAMRKECELLDGTRYYVPNSADTPLSGFGPYDVKEPEWYFEKRGTTLHSEIGIIAIPEVESFKKMMPAENFWPINDMWAIHDYQHPRSFNYTETINKRYGESISIEEYSAKAQLQNYETGKAMFECLQSNQGSGMLLWMSQSAWPSLICQLYDHYLEYTSSYFAVKKACSPVHAFYDPAKKEIRAANNTKNNIKKAKLSAKVYNSEGKIVWSKSSESDIVVASAKTFFSFEYKAVDKVQYLKLELTEKGKIISTNFYWLENNKGNCRDINDLPNASVDMKIVEGSMKGFFTAKVTLKNTSSTISLLNKIKLKEKDSGESILPVLYDDDYICLLPGEERIINISVSQNQLKNKKVEMQLEGWNTMPISNEINTTINQ